MKVNELMNVIVEDLKYKNDKMAVAKVDGIYFSAVDIAFGDSKIESYRIIIVKNNL